MDRVKDCFGKTLANLLTLAVKPDFYLKVIALCLTIATSLFWRIPDAGYSGMDGHFEELIFAHTVPGYLTVMFGLVLIYILGDRPNRWFYYVFYSTGIALLLLVGCFGVWNCMFEDHDWGSPPLYMAFSNLLTAAVIAVDLFWSTSLFGLCDKVRKSLDHGAGEKSDHEESDKGL